MESKNIPIYFTLLFFLCSRLIHSATEYKNTVRLPPSDKAACIYAIKNELDKFKAEDKKIDVKKRSERVPLWKVHDRFGRTPLWYVAALGHTDFARYLIDLGADMDQEDNFRLTPYDMAAANKCDAIVTLFKQQSSDAQMDDEIESALEQLD